MSWRLVMAAGCVSGLAACGAGEVEAPSTVRALGQLPAADLQERLPARVIPCFGLNLGLVSGAVSQPDREATARDLQMTCARASAELQGECASYAEKASALGVAIAEGRPAEEVNRASAAADAAVAECVAA